jgi:hypothetical protein
VRVSRRLRFGLGRALRVVDWISSLGEHQDARLEIGPI